MKTGLVIKGDVAEYKRFLTPNSTLPILEREIKRATIDNSLYLVSQVKQQIRDRRFTANAPLTLALSRGNLPLLKEKNLFDAIGFTLKTSFEAEVGLTERKLSTGGVKSRPTALEKIVLLLHDGFTIDVTDDMRAAIMAALRKSKGRKAKSAQKQASERSGRGRTVWRVPPRKFLTTVFRNLAIQERLRRRWREAVEAAFLKAGAKGGDHKDR
jgi:hypothetical protein